MQPIYTHGQRINLRSSKKKPILTVLITAFIVGGFFHFGNSTSIPAAILTLTDNFANAATADAETATLKAGVQTSIGDTKSRQLKKVLSAFRTENPNASLGIYVSSADGTISASINPNQSFDSASLYKTLAAYRVLQLEQSGKLSLDDKATSKFTIEDCIKKAISESDNKCGEALQILANPTFVDDLVLNWGYDHTSLSGVLPQTSAKDQVHMFLDIYNGELLDDVNRQYLLDQLEQQKIRDRIPEYADAIIYHKTGDIFDSVNSSSLIELESGEVYSISILTENWDKKLTAKYEAIRQLHTDVHEVFTNDL